jgi:hypothetical protein
MTAAEYLGYRIDHKPITISDVDQWQEVFVTSSLKIITPVRCVFLPNYGQKTATTNRTTTTMTHLQLIWSIPCRSEKENINENINSTYSVAQQLYRFILSNRTVLAHALL